MSAIKARKLPIIVEVMQFIGTDENILEMQKWCDHQVEPVRLDSKVLRVQCLEALATIGVGDYVVKGIKGEVWPVRKDIFEETYEIIQN